MELDGQFLAHPQKHQHRAAQHERQTRTQRRARRTHARRAEFAKDEGVQQRQVDQIDRQAKQQRRPRVAGGAQRARQNDVDREDPMMNVESQKILRDANCAVCSIQTEYTGDLMREQHAENHEYQSHQPPNISDEEVMRLASSCSPAPQERATSAVVPTPIAINKACSAKKTR